MITKLDFVAVPSRDAERSRSFYVDTLGLRPTAARVSSSGSARRASASGSPTSSVPTFAPQKNGHLALHVDDVAAARRELEGRAWSPGETFATGVCPDGLLHRTGRHDLMLHHRYAPRS